MSTARIAAEHSAFSTRAALASVTLALILLIAKAWAAYATDSTAMLGSLADTALDVIASITTLLGVRIAAVPADSDHRFGHSSRSRRWR
jgi:ferrous-iron efflux pump FieF